MSLCDAFLSCFIIPLVQYLDSCDLINGKVPDEWEGGNCSGWSFPKIDSSHIEKVCDFLLTIVFSNLRRSFSVFIKSCLNFWLIIACYSDSSCGPYKFRFISIT